MSYQADLLHEIEFFLRDRKMAESTFGRLAVNDGKFVKRLRCGLNFTVPTMERARHFIATFDSRSDLRSMKPAPSTTAAA